MPLCFYNIIGKMTIEQTRNGEKKRFKIDIQDGNCLAVFNYRYVDHGQKYVQLYSFFGDQQHVRNIIKNEGKLFDDKVISIELNMHYQPCKELLDIFVKQGYKVKCYYKKPDKKS